MQHRMTPRDAREAIDRKLSDALQVSPRSASNEQLYKACALVLRDLMSARPLHGVFDGAQPAQQPVQPGVDRGF